jgi:hypothetical protein
LITANVLDVYASFKACYGATRITKELAALGISYSKNYIAKIMHTEGIRRWAMSVLLNLSTLTHNQCLLFMGNTTERKNMDNIAQFILYMAKIFK